MSKLKTIENKIKKLAKPFFDIIDGVEDYEVEASFIFRTRVKEGADINTKMYIYNAEQLLSQELQKHKDMPDGLDFRVHSPPK